MDGIKLINELVYNSLLEADHAHVFEYGKPLFSLIGIDPPYVLLCYQDKYYELLVKEEWTEKSS